MTTTGRLVPVLVAAGLISGVVSGVYIWNAPLRELSGKTPAPGPVEDGRSQSVKDGKDTDGSPSSNPHPSLKSGGASPVNQGSPTVAGTSAEGRKSMSARCITRILALKNWAKPPQTLIKVPELSLPLADHNVSIRSNPKEQDGSAGGGQGLAEMRERKMRGQGGPSPQGGDTKSQPVAAVANEGAGGGVKKQGRWWLGGW
ncbi:hypothetical protein TREMEDRAFT_63889 [Tremella mesenterica DSM 1558]|uniref:uncharacterized protein n=1 Tax=Tremella mesenterica (strain ATCC 24925 / CBS 8224 / DSM 1558 / NBRC 9311 / NRRL Y-6157 / RJB 2259-6 / UBC 559-6) TaxID=578456 RepID=UPI0003F4947D|nr:uncharacterized protein TREMEDRAFT_63889 [Tremella mesenterica DSM 1558]EIW68005.1 hypothetical protein TREMEDRAFT_63889 [Tremella mesenterica DSM 1558]